MGRYFLAIGKFWRNIKAPDGQKIAPRSAKPMPPATNGALSSAHPELLGFPESSGCPENNTPFGRVLFSGQNRRWGVIWWPALYVILIRCTVLVFKCDSMGGKH